MKMQSENKMNQWVKRSEEILKKLITPKNIAVLTTVIYILGLIPLLWIAWYNYPSADDYSIGSACHHIWLSTHNPFVVIWQGMIKAVDDWLNWMGYFTSMFLMSIPPNAFGERWYVLTTWIILGMLSFSTLYLCKCVFIKILHGDKYSCHSIAMLILFTSVQCMCPAGRVEAFYWYSGAANYVFVHSMSLFFFGLLISAFYEKGKKKVWHLTAAAFMGFFTGGGNQVTALNVAIVLFGAIVLMTISKKWKICKCLWIPMATFYIGFILNVAAPGNLVRAEKTSGMNPLKAVLVSFYECLDFAMSEWTTWPVIVIMLALIPLFWHMVGKSSFQFPCPLLVLFTGFCLVAAMATPPLFALGNMGAGRLQALMFLIYVLVLALCIGYVTGWARHRWTHRLGNPGKKEREGFSAEGCWWLAGCIIFLVLGSGLTIVPEPHYYTFSSALADLSNGSAKAYGDALKERMEIYHSGVEGMIEVEPLPAQPVLLYFSDIKENPEDWENRGVSRFYGLDGVKIKDRQ